MPPHGPKGTGIPHWDDVLVANQNFMLTFEQLREHEEHEWNMQLAKLTAGATVRRAKR